jgi:predicted aminopeptidase
MIFIEFIQQTIYVHNDISLHMSFTTTFIGGNFVGQW